MLLRYAVAEIYMLTSFKGVEVKLSGNLWFLLLRYSPQ